ncbi:MAG: xanthine dehydrogenase family protein subunit M [Rhizobiaceae bacterium]|nr:xanthine dehydrogenase family protein subunit M [Rhizobiaceae bacterium]
MRLFRNPEQLEEAYDLLSSGNWKILSGGTDFYPSLGAKQPEFDVLDISRISSLRDIVKDDAGNWHIGALATWSDIINHDLPEAFKSLQLSAREVGSIQIQNRATVVGNICNASPAADGVPPLLTLGAVVKIGSAKNTREVPLEQFILGNRKVGLEPDELVTGLKIPANLANGKSTFLKLGARKYLVISISMIAARLVTGSDNIITDAAISIGSCSAVAVRLRELEKALIGQNLGDDVAPLLTDEHFNMLTPLNDVRATHVYRMEACREITKRAIESISRN